MMLQARQGGKCSCAIMCGFVLFTVFSHVQAQDPVDMLVEINANLYEVAEQTDGFLTLKGLRTATMAHLAMHDAINSVAPQFQTFTATEKSPQADLTAAFVQAAFAVINTEFPNATQLTQLQQNFLNAIPESARKSAGIALGNRIAATIKERRQGDGWDSEAEYQFHPMAPGVYAEFKDHSGTPQGFVFGTGWAQARGFALSKPDQFRAPPPPAIKSDAYTKAFNEVKSSGRFQSMTRTPDQTHIALWWKDFAENSHNRLARDLVTRESLSLHDAARLFALVNMSIYDAYISSFENKFHYNHWRPYTAIRWASNDENPDTEEEPTWTNTHRHTYAFPSYPSAHGTACAAAATAFATVLGNETSFTMRNPVVDIAGPLSGKINMQPPVRSFDSFSDAATECGLSRVYLGIHFRYDSEQGVALGKQVGNNVVEHWLLPIKKG